MTRYCSMILLAASLALVSFGCDKKPQQPRTEPPAETGAEQPQPDAEQADAGESDEDARMTDADGDEGEDAGQAADCPKPRDYQGMCAQVITWARNPDTGTCCQYGSPCEAPQNWQTFTSEADCVQAGGQTAQ